MKHSHNHKRSTIYKKLSIASVATLLCMSAKSYAGDCLLASGCQPAINQPPALVSTPTDHAGSGEHCIAYQKLLDTAILSPTQENVTAFQGAELLFPTCDHRVLRMVGQATDKPAESQPSPDALALAENDQSATDGSMPLQFINQKALIKKLTAQYDSISKKLDAQQTQLNTISGEVTNNDPLLTAILLSQPSVMNSLPSQQKKRLSAAINQYAKMQRYFYRSFSARLMMLTIMQTHGTFDAVDHALVSAPHCEAYRVAYRLAFVVPFNNEIMGLEKAQKNYPNCDALAKQVIEHVMTAKAPSSKKCQALYQRLNQAMSDNIHHGKLADFLKLDDAYGQCQLAIAKQQGSLSHDQSSSVPNDQLAGEQKRK